MFFIFIFLLLLLLLPPIPITGSPTTIATILRTTRVILIRFAEIIPYLYTIGIMSSYLFPLFLLKFKFSLQKMFFWISVYVRFYCMPAACPPYVAYTWVSCVIVLCASSQLCNFILCLSKLCICNTLLLNTTWAIDTCMHRNFKRRILEKDIRLFTIYTECDITLFCKVLSIVQQQK